MSQAVAEGRLEADAGERLDHPDLYLNRELSRFAFNERVLDQAADAR